MKSFKQYILEADDKKDEEALKRRADIKFTIWENPDKKVSWITDNEKYQKIEYKYQDRKKKINIDFLLGFDKKDRNWKVWIGKIGGVSYDDDPYYNLKTDKFQEAIISALDKVEEFIKKVEDEPHDWIQYYKDI